MKNEKNEKCEKNERKKNYCIDCDDILYNKTKTGLCKKCLDIKQRKVERPPYEQLLKEIKETSYSAVGRKYNVSDKSIKKWKLYYEKNI